MAKGQQPFMCLGGLWEALPWALGTRERKQEVGRARRRYPQVVSKARRKKPQHQQDTPPGEDLGMMIIMVTTPMFLKEEMGAFTGGMLAG